MIMIMAFPFKILLDNFLIGHLYNVFRKGDTGRSGIKFTCTSYMETSLNVLYNKNFGFTK